MYLNQFGGEGLPDPLRSLQRSGGWTDVAEEEKSREVTCWERVRLITGEEGKGGEELEDTEGKV